jgi:hypothetical protein
MVLGKVVIYLQKTKTRSLSLTLYKINSKWIKDLNVRPEILKSLLGKIGKSLEDTGTGNFFSE